MESAVIATPLISIAAGLTAHIRPLALRWLQASGIAMIGSRFGRWLPLLFVVTAAVDGWLTLGTLGQSTVIAAALLRRLRVKVRSVAGRTDDLA
jgi:hypothetical protein